MCSRILTDVKRKEKRSTTLQNVVRDSLAIYLGGSNSPTRGLTASNGPPRSTGNDTKNIHERSHRWFVVREILYKGTLARNSWCSRRRRIDEADISTTVAVDQNVLPTARRKLYGHSPPCGSDVDRHLPRSTASFSSCSVLLGPLLPNLHHCGTVPLHTGDRKILLLEGRLSFPIQTTYVVGIPPYFVVKAYLGLT
ncbi:hypothetical protein TNCV_1213941 [Trichonephila clavipes]|nr:hypothetical protein TNCV_1213941 [Trichonephila clavipes]